ncbi:MAG: dihydropteroate synthase [Deltaproteobacteria bacterium]|nr:dihydropteroate synthase [Deltaproteobacteria bacterium]
MLIIAERINASRKSISQAISSKDRAFIQNEAINQDRAGADYIDVNAGTFVGEEAEKLKWIIEAVQEVSEKPLCIDSPDPAVIKAMVPLVDRTPMINSITLEQERMEGILPIVAEHKTKVIALCQSETAMADTADDKLRLAEQLVKRVTDAEVPVDNLYIDPLVYPLATNTRSAAATLNAIEKIMKEFPGVHTTCGLTNVSHGLPNRKLINRTFLISAIVRGLDSAILDPTDRQLYGTLKAALAVAGRDDFCMGYITAFREGRLE